VTLTRGEPSGSQAAEISFAGAVEVSEGVAAFDLFPYEFRGMTARVTFNNDRVDIERVDGQSESGAKLEAHGYIAPLDDRAEMLIDVKVTGAPIDAKMEAAFGPDRQTLVPALFNREKHEELLSEGLVRTPEQAAVEAAELERLRAAFPTLSGDEAAGSLAEITRLSARSVIPVFPFRGLVDVAVRTFSPKGRGTGWRTQVDIDLPRVGLVPERFPLPVIAENVHVRVVDENGQITSGTFRGLNGGTGDVEAYFDIPAPGAADQQAHPEITIAAKGVPLDELVIHALPEGQGAGDDAPQLKPMLRRLQISGTGDADVRIADRPTAGRPTGFDAQVRIAGAHADPEPWPGAGSLLVSDIAGKVVVNEEQLTLELSGQPGTPPRVPGVELPAPVGAPVAVRVDAAFARNGAEARTSLKAVAEARGVSVAAPLETLVGAFSPEGARQIADLRRLHNPSGDIDAKIRLDAPAGASVGVEVDFTNPRSLAADVLGGRLEVPSAEGTATLVTSERVVRFAGVRAPIAFQNAGCGNLLLSGDFPVGDGATAGAAAPRALTLSMHNGLFEAPIVFRVLEDRIGREAALAFGDYHARGLFDGELRLSYPDAGGAPDIHGTVRPHTLGATVAGTPVALSDMHGELEFDRTSGTFRDLGGRAEAWSGTRCARSSRSTPGSSRPIFARSSPRRCAARSLRWPSRSTGALMLMMPRW
jgi:hypothetical protein